MIRRKRQTSSGCRRRCQKPSSEPRSSQRQLRERLRWMLPNEGLFHKEEFHGNVRWNPHQVAAQALLWSWQETRHVTDAFEHATEVCVALGFHSIARSYTSLMNALGRYTELLIGRVRERLQGLAIEVGERYFRRDGWVPIGFDGSRIDAPRTVSNEQAYCAPRYGQGKRAKYGPKKSRGMRRRRNRAHPAQPPKPQAWLTLFWHMGLRLPWTWRVGPSNASERDHVKDVLAQEDFPENTLFCGDAGFVGYELWQSIRNTGGHFLVRVGANTHLLTEHADVKPLRGGIVLCWPQGQQAAGAPPLRLRLVKVRVGRTPMWLLTSVLEPARLTRKQMVRFYKLRWGIEVEFRGLKQTLDKHALRCRQSERLRAELEWSLCGLMAAELLALREQLVAAGDTDDPAAERSLAKTMRALRRAMRQLNRSQADEACLTTELAQAQVQRYRNGTNKQSRYRPKNPDKKPLGDPVIHSLSTCERTRLQEYRRQTAA
jgi:hypothetical protein